MLPSKEEQIETRLTELERRAEILLQDRLAQLGRGEAEFYELLVSSLLKPASSPEVNEWAASLSELPPEELRKSRRLSPEKTQERLAKQKKARERTLELVFNLAVQVGTLRRIRECLQRGDLLQALDDALWLINPGHTAAAWIALTSLREKTGRKKAAADWTPLQNDAEAIWVKHPGYKKEKVANELGEKYPKITPSTIKRHIWKPKV